MSTQQIPSVAQIAAARSALWHQNTPEPVTSAEPSKSLVRAAEGESSAASETQAVISSGSTAEATAPADNAGDTPAVASSLEQSASPTSVDAPEEHPGIDLSDLEGSNLLPAEAAASVALLTQAGARDFLNRTGLLLFAAKPQFSGVPAPTFVEATLGAANANPSLSASATARTLLARLVADGSAVPLNLLGLPSTTAEAPDFVVSAAAFPFIFTLRGDKAWKQPPSTSGPTKVSPLAANTFTLLLENGPNSAYALTSDLGKEVTEAAVLRALSELWQQLRVIPVPQPGNKPTIWEPITTRFTKQIKTGANAGQPTALSTFISLYLGQSILATEDEIETFLSPLAPRSRVRDVIHALSGARQLETITVEGKHHLHVAGDLPLFETTKPAAHEPSDIPVLAEDGSRIKKFVPKPRKLGTGSADRPKPFRAPSDRGRADSRSDRRPTRSAGDLARPTFTKPWDEEKRARTDRIAASRAETPSEYQDIDLDAGTRPEASRRAPSAGRPSFGNKAAFGRKPSFGGKPGIGDRPRVGGDRPAFNRDRPSGDRSAFNRDRTAGDRPAFSRDRSSFDRAPREGGGNDRFQPRDSRRDFTPHAASGDSRPPRHFGNKPGFSSKPGFPRKPFDPERSAGDRERRPFRRDAASTGGDSRPPRRTFDSSPRSGGSDSRPPFPAKPRFTRDRDTEGGGRPPFRKFDAPRTPRPSRDGDSSRPPRREFDKERPAPRGGYSDTRSLSAKSSPRREGFIPREGGSFPPRRDGGFPGKREGGFAGKKPFGARSASGGPGKPFKKPFSRSAPDAPGASTFDKFKGNAKPWGKRPPARKYKPKEDEA